jgi:muramoyltetrapeptide carboxypeptidase
MPPAVRPGDRIAVVAPAAPIEPDRLRAGLARLGGTFRVVLADDVTRRTGFLAGSDARRAAELDAALRDPDVRAILMARGGYGISRLLPLLDPAALRADPKPIVGFSDGTALLAWAARAGVRGIHGPVIRQLTELPDEDVAALIRALTDPAPAGRLAGGLASVGAPWPAPRQGRLVGGNLTLLAHLIGTPWQVDAAGAVVLLEEVGEEPYRIDRDLTQLGHAGALAGAAAVLLGGLTRCGDPVPAAGAPDDDRAARAVVDERLRHLGLPGRAGAPVGHGARNLAVPWGARVALDDAGTVEILDGAVA